jgi:DNA-directed RNA polymerase subunit RPC12/RpoP
MKERVKRVIKICLLFVVLVIPFSYLSLVKADSGWDTGYSSGGGGGGWSSSGGGGWSSGGSSWSTGGSSRSRDGDYDYDGSGKGVILMFFIIFIVIVVVSILSENSGNNSNNIKAEYMAYPDIDESLIKQYLPDHTLGSLKNMAYKKFLAIQNAWMNFDYDALRELCTDELFNTYKSQLKVLEMKNQKNIMTNFALKENRIIGINASEGLITVEVYMRVQFFDYVINVKNNEAIMGTANVPITNNYKMKYVVSKNRKLTNKCPNCGAPINATTSKECEYCGSTIVFDSNDFVLSKKTNEKTTR